MNELSKKNQLLILRAYKDYYAFFTYALSYSLHKTTSILNYDNVNYGSATVVSIVLHLHHLGWILDKFILCPYRSTLNTIETRLCTQNECPMFTILGSFGGGIDLQIKSTFISHGCFIFMDAERIELCDNVISTMLMYHWCR
jgi:hypothetical protein